MRLLRKQPPGIVKGLMRIWSVICVTLGIATMAICVIDEIFYDYKYEARITLVITPFATLAAMSIGCLIIDLSNRLIKWIIEGFKGKDD